MNVTEDYVSFETAKLLKERGFPQSKDIAMAMYNETGALLNLCTNTEEYYIFEDFDEYDCVAVSLAMAMKWLREIHHLHISTDWYYKNDPVITDDFTIQYQFTITSWLSPKEHFDEGWYDTHEDACKAAIKYCLENLI